MTQQEHYRALITELRIIRGYFTNNSSHIAAVKIDQRLQDIYEVTDPYEESSEPYEESSTTNEASVLEKEFKL